MKQLPFRTTRPTAAVLLGMTLMISGCGAEADRAESSEGVEAGTSTTEEVSPSADSSLSRDLFAMDTYMTITAYGEHATEALEVAEARINELDALLSTGDESSEIYQLNQTHQAQLSDDSRALMEASLRLNQETDGAFNIAIYPLMSLWGFPTQEYRVPSEAEIQETLPHTDIANVQYDSETGDVSFSDPETAIDFGGIAKGYTSDSLMEIFRNCGVTSGLVNLGGNVQTLGTKPDGSAWNVAVRTPDDTGNILCVAAVSDEAVITSGGYERYFEEDGVTYHHILDPKTGRPADSGLTSVTIIGKNGTVADGLSTSLFIMGKEKAVEFWRSGAEDFEMILVEEDGTVSATAGLSDRLTSEYEIEIIS